MGSAADRAGGASGRESQTQIQVPSYPNVNAVGTPNQNPSFQHPGKSTWELLLNDEQVVRYANNSNIEILLRDVSLTLDSLEATQVSLPSVTVSHIPQPKLIYHTHQERRIKISQSTDLETAPSHFQKKTNAHYTPPAQPGAYAPSSMVCDVLEFYPDPQLALRLWNVYVRSVDPVLKILHIPTVQSAVVATILDPRSAPSSTVALTFAIYFAAVTALCHDNNNEPNDLPWEKPVLLKRYKIALDRLLMATDLMNSPEMTALQALAIYVTCLRVHEVGRSVWVLNGLAIRLAQSIGLHRDGSCLQLSPFETEMRLRLWWHLCVLDSRAPEDQGFQPTVDVVNRELRLPLNVNDNQIYPDMTRFPVESDGWTEMSFFLIQTESCRLLHPILDTQEQQSGDALLDITEKRKIIQERGQYLSAKYGIKYGISSESAIPTELSRIAIQHTTTACKKMEFVLQLREEIIMRKQKGASQDDATPDVLKPSFKLACDGLESNYVLLKEGLASRFRWFFNMYTQWYALAYVLRCLCSSPYGFDTERAWTLVEELFPRGMSLDSHSAGSHDEPGHASIWRCLNLLRYQALQLRQHAAAQLSVAPTAADVELQPPPPSSSGGDPSTSQLLLPATASQGISTTTTLPDFNPQADFIPDPNQSIFSTLDPSMPDIQFLPDWNAVINGWLNDDGGGGGGHSNVL